MRCIAIMDGRFSYRNGAPASYHMHYENFSRHYTSIFEHFTVVGRVFPDGDGTALPVVGEKVDFIAIPSYHGPGQFLKVAPKIARLLWRISKEDAAFILRVPGTLPLIFAIIATVRGIPYSVECVADPAQQLGEGSVRHPLRRWFRRMFIAGTRWQCRSAAASTYVTREALQTAYPPKPGRPTFSFTDLVIDEDSLVKQERAPDSFDTTTPTIVNVGMMIQLYKGQDVLLSALRRCHDLGLKAKLRLIGDGPYRDDLEHMARDLGLVDHVTFVGKLQGGAPVRNEIDRADLFALPSRQEGLPRALLEAMARAAPCIASDVGGIPELLSRRYLVPSGDVEGLAQAIVTLASNADRLAVASRENLEAVQEYRFDLLNQKRQAYYRAVLAAGMEQR
ncbi:glycosyltransferase family 4 protein [Magnetospirillum fulvum]|uniref:Group 1 glycosyl transferase n=1 Tax=Magnetospirillum fulvum MGU-K5 TaxID=1316936 RepID=S9SCR2_MAGFU|nr:glycosyltransferase family 4 protein [Magnetospirillum fulvum]EPY02514.1 group 1 glycosyl transferase [Magnetospirillum fulvum MGU-K5]